ncbi:MAG TPA: hypothetical protein VD735_07505 [Candidatus Saccharimonadales bacterium]|nr:hypothetical protein [Candidatus Saccharimonadales bacterium]
MTRNKEVSQVPNNETTQARYTEKNLAVYSVEHVLASTEFGRRVLYRLAQEGDPDALVYYPNAQAAQAPATPDTIPLQTNIQAKETEAAENNTFFPPEWAADMGSAAVNGGVR